MGADVMLEQRITVQRGDRVHAFRAVLQKQGGRLLLLGLGPFGTRAFAIEERGTAVHTTVWTHHPLPFSPRWVLLDVQRTFFPGVPGAPLGDGVHEAAVRGERIRERWRGGALIDCTFTRLDGKPPGRIRIDYGAGMKGGVPPPMVHLHNGWLGYDLTIRTLARRPL